jgi:SWI/SNF-related matrix-associated actin-dependent regulator 1 of chromatin subfamily A
MTGITPKQQSRIRVALMERTASIGISEDEIDNFIEEQKLDSLTIRSGIDLESYIKGIPVTRNESQLHLPVNTTAIIVNTRKDKCVLCGEIVETGNGYCAFHDGGWDTYHRLEDCSPVVGLSANFIDTARVRRELESMCSVLPRIQPAVVPDPYLMELSKAHNGVCSVDLKLPLLNYQKASVEYAIRTKRCLITDAMGLGKTPTGIAIALNAITEGKKALIVVPAHLRWNWVHECEKFAPWMKVTTVSGRTPYKIDSHDALIISDSIVANWQNVLMQKYQCLIVDEAHSVKNMKAQRSRAIYNIANMIDRDGYVVLMSGTITPNRPSELVSPLRIIDRLDSVFGTRRNFYNRYCDYKVVNGFPNYSGATNTSELNQILTGTCMARHRKEDVLTELPPKRRAQVDVELSDQVMTEYRKAETDFLTWVYETYGLDALVAASNAKVIVQMNKLWELLGLAKVNAVVEHCLNILAEGEQVVVFAHHTSVIKDLKEKLGNKHKVVVINGGVDAKTKHNHVEKFQRGEIDVIIGQYMAAGTGITLTSSRHVVLAQLPWSPSMGEQAEDRCHRVGTVNPVVAWWFTAIDPKGAGTIDSQMWRVLNDKKEVVSSILNGWAVNMEVEAGSITALILAQMMKGM